MIFENRRIQQYLCDYSPPTIRHRSARVGRQGSQPYSQRDATPDESLPPNRVFDLDQSIINTRLTTEEQQQPPSKRQRPRVHSSNSLVEKAGLCGPSIAIIQRRNSRQRGAIRARQTHMMDDHLRGMHTTLTTSIVSPTPALSSIPEVVQKNIQALLASQASAFQESANGNGASIEQSNDSTFNGVVIGLLSSFGSAILIAFIFLIVYFFRYTSSGRIFLDRIGRPGEYDDEQQYAREEAEALEEMDDSQRAEYLRAKAFIQANPPDSLPTDISLSQYLAIQEKGVSAWEFEPELEVANCFVEARTEIEFFDSESSVLTNLPIPKQNEVYYWESKIYDKPESTLLSIGVATKPYPLFRLPGWHKYSVAYTSSGHRRYNQPFTGPAYGPQFVQGDVIGVGYRPRTGTIFFTRNGKKLDDVAHGLKTQNLFPAVGANGPCTVHVNFGQSGFVFIEANVKKWGLAPMTGSLAPPPPYGSEQGSILLEAGREGAQSSQGHYSDSRHGRTRSGNFRHGPPTSPGPVRSPTDISLAHLTHIPSNEVSGEYSAAVGGEPQPGLGSHDQAPPEYTSPRPSNASSPRGSTDHESTPILRRKPTPPPIPSYNDAVAEDMARERSLSHSVDGDGPTS